MEGQLNDGLNGTSGIRYLTRMQIINSGGRFVSLSQGFFLKNADEAWIIISSSTNLLDNGYTETVNSLLAKAK